MTMLKTKLKCSRLLASLPAALLLMAIGCSSQRPHLTVPLAPRIPDAANFYKLADYQNDIAAYNAAVEMNLSTKITACPSPGGVAGTVPAKLVFCSIANGAAGSALTGLVVVQVQDASGNLVSAATNSIAMP